MGPSLPSLRPILPPPSFIDDVLGSTGHGGRDCTVEGRACLTREPPEPITVKLPKSLSFAGTETKLVSVHELYDLNRIHRDRYGQTQRQPFPNSGVNELQKLFASLQKEGVFPAHFDPSRGDKSNQHLTKDPKYASERNFVKVRETARAEGVSTVLCSA